MDNDTSTLARARREVQPDLKKKSDKNHTKKSITGALYDLANKHGQLKSPKLKSYIRMLVMAAIEQNQDDPEGVKRNLTTIVPHIYGKLLFMVSFVMMSGVMIDNPTCLPHFPMADRFGISEAHFSWYDFHQWYRNQEQFSLC